MWSIQLTLIQLNLIQKQAEPLQLCRWRTIYGYEATINSWQRQRRMCALGKLLAISQVTTQHVIGLWTDYICGSFVFAVPFWSDKAGKKPSFITLGSINRCIFLFKIVEVSICQEIIYILGKDHTTTKIRIALALKGQLNHSTHRCHYDYLWRFGFRMPKGGPASLGRGAY